MNISDRGIEWLKTQEGRVMRDGRHVVYDDATGRPVTHGAPLPPGATIGYGHLIKPGQDFSAGITDAAATALLRDDVAAAQRAVCASITVPLTQPQYDALVALAYNIGGAAFRGSTVVRYINDPKFKSSQYPTLESAWHAWAKCRGKILPGLINRRRAEWKLYSTGVY